MGHFSRDCPLGSVPMCFHYNQVGHKKADCPMLRGGAVSAPTLITLRITDSPKGRVGALAARSRALRCQSGEARVSSDAVAGMLYFFLHASLSV